MKELTAIKGYIFNHQQQICLADIHRLMKPQALLLLLFFLEHNQHFSASYIYVGLTNQPVTNILFLFHHVNINVNLSDGSG